MTEPVRELTPDEQREFQARQKSRALITAVLLGLFCILMFFITLAKIKSSL